MLLLPLLLSPLLGSLPIHEGEHAQIERATARIAAAPEAGAPYLHRAQLHREHGNLTAAAKDLAVAVERLGETIPVRMERIALHIADGRWQDALPLIEQALEDLPADLGNRPDRHDLGLLQFHAEVLEEMKRPADAVAAWTRLLAVHPEPTPGMYLARAAWQPHGEALAGLESGLARLKGCVSLELAAAVHEEALGRIDAAFARLQRLVDASPRKETWLTEQGELLLRGGRPLDAIPVLRRAKSALHALPSSKQGTYSMRALEARLQKALQEAEA